MVGGIVLVAIGLFLLAAQVVPDIGRLIPLILGIILLAMFAARREYGLLIAGCIVGGVGIGVVLQGMASGTEAGGIVLVSLGLGFVAIYAISLLLGLPEAHWWPLVPGGIMTFIGAVLLSGRVVDDVFRWWPLVLVALGVLVMVRAVVSRRSVP
jgi:hypothetical protein